MAKDYLPHGDVPFLEWVTNFIIYVLMYLVKWGLPAGCADRLNELLGKYKLALEVAHDARHTTQDIEKKNEAKEELMAEVRQFVGRHISYNKLITNDERKVCRLPIYDDTRTPSPIPDFFPMLEKILQKAKARIEVWTVDSKYRKKAKPAYVHGIEIVYLVSREKAQYIRELTHSMFTTRSSFIIQLTDEESTEYFSFAMRYENSRGEKGPWSEIYHIVIS
jgi:hypothetical protein